MLRASGIPLCCSCTDFMIASSRVSVNYDGRGGTAPDRLRGIKGVGLSIARLGFRLS